MVFNKVGKLYMTDLKKYLDKHRYKPVKYTPGFLIQKYRPSYFTLIIHDFLIRYSGEQHA